MIEEPFQPLEGGGDPLRRSRRTTRRVALYCGCALFAVAIWAFRAPNLAPIQTPELAKLSPPEDAPVRALDLAAFETPVWAVAEPPRKKPPPPLPPPPPPLRVQLLAILKDGERHKAVLYDPDTNKVRVAEAGEEVQGKRIEGVALDTVSIRNGPLLQELVLKPRGVKP